MRIALIFPIRKHEHKYIEIVGLLNKKIHNDLKTLGADHIDVKFPGLDYNFVANNESKEPMPKGKGILDSLKNMPQPPDFVIVCDGSGKIPYTYVSDIFQELVSDRNVASVMANRGKFKAIDNFRYLLERLEIFFLRKYHKHSKIIPDGQCGLWAYRYGKLNLNGKEEEIKLTADGYEIELDLLNEVLFKNLRYSFVNVELPEITLSSGYNYIDNIKKLNFLCTKCDKLKDCVHDYTKEFESTDECKELLKKLQKEELEAFVNYKKDLYNFVKSS